MTLRAYVDLACTIPAQNGDRVAAYVIGGVKFAEKEYNKRPIMVFGQIIGGNSDAIVGKEIK